MSQANVNVGTAPGAGNGDTLYNAFTKINTNFTELYSTITSSGTTYANIAPSVDSSASGSGLTLNITKYANIYGVSVNLPGTSYALGETVRIWGNVVGGTYTTHDLVVEVGTLANSSIGSVGTVTFTGTPSRPVLTVAGRTGDVVLTTNDIVGLRSTFSSNADIQNAVDGKIASNIANLVGTAPGVLDTLGEIADAINDDANIATTLTTTITTANTNMKGYVDGQITTANTNVVGYVDSAVTTANTNMKGYVDNELTSYATTSALTTANLNLKGYVDGEIATVTAGHYANSDVKSYLTEFDGSIIPSADITYNLGNVTHRWNDLYLNSSTIYLGDSTITTVDGAVVTAKGRTVANVLYANSASISTVTLSSPPISASSTYRIAWAYQMLDPAGPGDVGYQDFTPGNYTVAGTTLTLGSTVSIPFDSAGFWYAVELYSDTGAVSSADTVKTSNLSPIDSTITLTGHIIPDTDETYDLGSSSYKFGNLYLAGSTIYIGTETITESDVASWATETFVTTANTNVVGYVDSAVTTANTNLKGYTDNKFGAFTLNSATNLIQTANGAANVSVSINGSDGATPVPAFIMRKWSFNTDGTISFADPFLGSPLANGVVSTTKIGQWDEAYGWGNHASAGYSSGSDVTTANTNMKGYVDGQVTTLNSSITTANTNVVGYVDGQVTTLNSTITTANTNMQGYVDDAVSTANVNLKGYVDNTFLTSNDSIVATTLKTITTDGNNEYYLTFVNSDNSPAAEETVYTDESLKYNPFTGRFTAYDAVFSDQVLIGAGGTVIDNESLNLSGGTFYLGGGSGGGTTGAIQLNATGQIKIASGGTDYLKIDDGSSPSFVVYSDISMGGLNTITNTKVGNWDTAYSWGDHASAGYATTSDVTTANVNLKGYVDAANVNVVGYIDNEIAGLVDSAPATLDTLNEIAAALGDDPNLATTLTNTITTANVNMKGYVDNAISGVTTDVVDDTTPQLGGNLDLNNSSITGTGTIDITGTAETSGDITVGAKLNVTGSGGYGIIIQNNQSVSWYDSTDTYLTQLEATDATATRTIALPDATGTVALTSDVTTANVNLKGYVDNEISGLSLGNIATINLDGNVSNVLAGDGTFITAGSGGSGLADVVDDTTPQLGGNLDLNGSYITGTGNIAITGNIIGDNRVTGSLTVDDSIAVENNVTLNGGTIQIEGQTGNISATNINLSGDLDILGDVTSALTIQSNDLTVNNSNVVVVGYVVGDTVTTSSGGVTINDADVTLGGNVTATQNIIGGTLTSTGNVDASGSITGNGLFSLGDVVGTDFYGANFYGGNVTIADATIIFEGATADAFETTLAVTDPTADRTITFPDATGTVALTSDVTTANVNLKGYVDSLSHYEDSDVNTLLASWGSNTLSTTGNVTVGDAIIASGTKEKFSSLTSATGTVTHDCDNGHIFYHTSLSANFTANFTNLELDTAHGTTVTLVLVQGATAFIPTALQIGGSGQTINWQGGSEPTGTNNGIDVVTFSILNNSGTYTVLGQLVDF